MWFKKFYKQYRNEKISVDEPHEKHGLSDRTFIDTRKTSDHEVLHIENVVGLDMGVVVSGNDVEAVKENAAEFAILLNGNN